MENCLWRTCSLYLNGYLLYSEIISTKREYKTLHMNFKYMWGVFPVQTRLVWAAFPHSRTVIGFIYILFSLPWGIKGCYSIHMQLKPANQFCSVYRLILYLKPVRQLTLTHCGQTFAWIISVTYFFDPLFIHVNTFKLDVFKFVEECFRFKSGALYLENFPLALITMIISLYRFSRKAV